MLKRTILALFVGSICGAIFGAAGFAPAERVLGRGIGILGNSPSLAALIGAVYLGTWGGVMGAIIGIANLNASRSGVFGLACGVLLVIKLPPPIPMQISTNIFSFGKVPVSARNPWFGRNGNYGVPWTGPFCFRIICRQMISSDCLAP